MKNENITITLLLPTFNEIDGFRNIFPKVNKELFDDILVVDGGSKDGTVEFAFENNIRIMTQLRSGLSEAVIDAIDTIKTDYVIEFSMDGNCLPELLEPLVSELKNDNDMVIVSRYLPPAKSYDDNFITAIGNYFFSSVINAMGKPKITDSLGMYRGFKVSIVDYPEFRKFLIGPVFEPLTSMVACSRNLKVKEIAGDEPLRLGGQSKMRVIYNGSCILLAVIRIYIFKFFKIII
tara:strand:+ start:724 stop:1428 length:705 start_codon:yes stop_codon:yes gene_type:complete